MKTLDIRVAFSAVDRLTRPAENSRRLMGQFGDSIQRTQGAIKNLERQARSFERARDAVSKADAGIVKARRQLNALNQLQRTGTVLSEKQQKLMQQLSTRLERLNESRTREIQKMRELGGELKRHGISLTGSDNTIQQAIRRTEQYNNQLERERQALARVTRARERYSRAQETAGKLKTGGALAIGAAAAGGYAAGRFLQPAIGFGKEMSRVQALTRIDQNSPQFKALREQALKLGSETQFTAGDAASGQAFLAMAGFTPQAIQAALPGVLSMATAGGMDLGETADIGSNILTQFGLSADQMDRVGDTLTAAFTRTNTDLRALGETMKYAGPVWQPSADCGAPTSPRHPPKRTRHTPTGTATAGTRKRPRINASVFLWTGKRCITGLSAPTGRGGKLSRWKMWLITAGNTPILMKFVMKTPKTSSSISICVSLSAKGNRHLT